MQENEAAKTQPEENQTESDAPVAWGAKQAESQATSATPDASREERVSSGKDSAGSSKEKSRSKKKDVLGWILAIVIAVAAAFIIRAFFFEFVLVEGPSMQPTLVTGERIGIEKVSRYSSLPERGDIVVVKYPNREGNFIKRAIGLPGETIEIIDSTVYIDGVPLEENYVSDPPYADMAPVVVPEDHVFVMGDNRSNSSDSRAVGAIPRSDIVGHGLFVIWPFSQAHML